MPCEVVMRTSKYCGFYDTRNVFLKEASVTPYLNTTVRKIKTEQDKKVGGDSHHHFTQ